MPGQTVKLLIKDSEDYVIKGTGTDEQDDLVTRVTIKDWAWSVDNPQIHIYPDTSNVEGKSFNVTYSPEGKEIENVEIDNLPMVSMGMTNWPPLIAKRFFSDLLPILPDDNIKIGDTWTTPLDEKRQSGQIEYTFKGETINTLEGFETIQGMECVRIKGRVTGAAHRKGKLEGKDFKLTAEDSDTTITWYFAYKKGIFVKSIVESIGSMEGTNGSLKAPLMIKVRETVELVQQHKGI